MRKVLTIVLSALLGLSAVAQTPEDYHFSVKDRTINWQLVYESPVDSTAVIDYLVGSGNFADLAETTNGLSFSILPRSIDHQAAGVKTGATPIYILNGRMAAHGLLQMREGRYRVTVDRISFQDGINPIPLESYVLNKQSGFKSVFISMNAARVIDYELTELFKIPAAAEEEDW